MATTHSARFRIRSDDPKFFDQFIAKTGLGPSQIAIKGQLKYEGSPWLLEDNCLFIKAPFEEEVEISQHLCWLWDQLKSHKEYIKELVKRPDLVIDILCNYTSTSGCAGVTFSPESLKVLTELRIPLEYSLGTNMYGNQIKNHLIDEFPFE